MSQTMKECPTCDTELVVTAEVCTQCDQEFCPECWGPISVEDEACPSCGLEFAFVCPQCEEEVDAAATICPHCNYNFEFETEESGQVSVISSRSTVAHMTATDANLAGELDGEQPDGNCPNCEERIFKVDGYCEACGASYCPSCVGMIDDESEGDECPYCGVLLYFDCPGCGFELTTGTDLCPECHMLFPTVCPTCSAEVENPLAEACTQCDTPLSIQQRKPANISNSLVVDQRMVRIFTCTNCGDHYDSKRPICQTCGEISCPNCLLVLEADETACPRCSLVFVKTQARENDFPCPSCQTLLEKGSEICSECDQLLCPECGAATGEDDLSCAVCGIEFELACPNCDAVVSVESEICLNCGTEL